MTPPGTPTGRAVLVRPWQWFFAVGAAAFLVLACVAGAIALSASTTDPVRVPDARSFRYPGDHGPQALTLLVPSEVRYGAGSRPRCSVHGVATGDAPFFSFATVDGVSYGAIASMSNVEKGQRVTCTGMPATPGVLQPASFLPWFFTAVGLFLAVVGLVVALVLRSLAGPDGYWRRQA